MLDNLAPMSPEAIAFDLMARGYRRVSTSRGIVARIDDPNWIRITAEYLDVSVANMTGPNWPDYYRRRLSQDRFVGLPEAIVAHVKNSANDPCGFVAELGVTNGRY